MMNYLNLEFVQLNLPKRPKNSHKGMFGKVLVVAGSKKFPGAAILAAKSAYRIGAGLVTVVALESLYSAFVKALPEAVFTKVPDENGFFSSKSIPEIFLEIEKNDIVLLGPGLGIEPQTRKFINLLLKKEISQKTFLLDADGLNLVSEIDGWWKRFSKQTIITPHPKEMMRLTGIDVEKIQSNRDKIISDFSEKWQKVIVLKGAESLIAQNSKKMLKSSFANPLLSTAGTGDVLAGIIAGLYSQGLDSFSAAAAGVYLHGLAADLLTGKFGDSGVIASDLIEILPEAIKKVKQI